MIPEGFKQFRDSNYYISQGAEIYSIHSNKILSGFYRNTKGYVMIDLYIKGKRYKLYLHRIVAECHIPNPLNLPIVNHKDEDKDHNYSDNLEWMTQYDNCIYSDTGITGGKSTSLKYSKCVEQLDLNDNIVAVFDNPYQAERITGIAHQSIKQCCRGKLHHNTAGGYKWRFKS